MLPSSPPSIFDPPSVTTVAAGKGASQCVTEYAQPAMNETHCTEQPSASRPSSGRRSHRWRPSRRCPVGGAEGRCVSSSGREAVKREKTHDVEPDGLVDEKGKTSEAALCELDGLDLLGVRPRRRARVRRRRVGKDVVELGVRDAVLRRGALEREQRDVRLEVVVDLAREWGVSIAKSVRGSRSQNVPGSRTRRCCCRRPG